MGWLGSRANTVDFVEAIQVYKEVGYPYLLMPDHVLAKYS
jgi:hypothetical protein